MKLIASVTALALSTFNVLSMPLPAHADEPPTEASAPAENVPAFTANSVYRGVWEGGLESFFEVFSNSDGKIVAEYRWGGPRTKPGSRAITVECVLVADSSCTWGDGTTQAPKFTLSPANNGGFRAERIAGDSKLTTEYQRLGDAG